LYGIVVAFLPEGWSWTQHQKAGKRVRTRSTSLTWDVAVFDDEEKLRGVGEWDGPQHFARMWCDTSDDRFFDQIARDSFKDIQAETLNVPCLRVHDKHRDDDEFVADVVQRFFARIQLEPGHFMMFSDPDDYAAVYSIRDREGLVWEEDNDDEDDNDDDEDDDSAMHQEKRRRIAPLTCGS